MLRNRLHNPRLWLNRDFVLLWSGQVVSATGSQVSAVVIPLFILSVSHSPAQAGLVGAAGWLSYLLAGLPGGALVDRWDRKRVMIVCDACRCLNMASVPLLAAVWKVTVIQLGFVSVVEGGLAVFFTAAEAAALPRIVPREQLAPATAQTLAADRISVLAGPPIGGLLYGAVGRIVPFLADAVSYGGSVVSLLFIRTRFQEEEARPRATGLRHEILEGVTWLWRRPLLRFITLTGAGVNLIFGGSTLVVIVLARHLHASPPVIGLVLAAGGVGGIAGSFAVDAAQRRFGIGRISIGVHWLWAVLWLIYVVAPNPVVLGILEAPMLALSTLRTSTLYSYRLALIPDALQGRVNSVARLIGFAGQPLSLAITGTLLQSVGLYATILIIGACLVVLSTIVTGNKSLREAPRLAVLAASTD